MWQFSAISCKGDYWLLWQIKTLNPELQSSKQGKRRNSSDIVVSSYHKLCVLFKGINAALNVPQTEEIDSFPSLCEKILLLFPPLNPRRDISFTSCYDREVFENCSFEPTTLLFCAGDCREFKYIRLTQWHCSSSTL